VKLAVGAVLVLAALSSLPIIFLSLVIIAKGGFYGNTFDVFTTAHTPMDAVFHGILFAVTLFIGFEAAASIAEESRSPRTAIPVAVLATIAISAAFFILVTYAVSIGYGLAAINKGAWANSRPARSTTWPQSTSEAGWARSSTSVSSWTCFHCP